LKLITVGFRGYRVYLNLNRLVNRKLKYDVHLFLVTKFTKHAVQYNDIFRRFR